MITWPLSSNHGSPEAGGVGDERQVGGDVHHEARPQLREGGRGEGRGGAEVQVRGDPRDLDTTRAIAICN